MFGKIITVCLFALTAAETVRYDNYSLYKLQPQNEDQVRFLKELQQSEVDYDFWKPASTVDEFVSVVSPPELKDELENVLKKRSIHSELMVENIQAAFDAQVMSRKKRDTSRQLYWTGYQTLDDINDWFRYLEETNPGVVTVVVAGQSHEGRNLTGVRISRGSGRRAFVLEAGQIGADWLSPVVLTYIVNQLVTGTDDEAVRASQDFDWYIFPSANPDGFQFTQDAVRLWVKNTRPVYFGSVGVDLTKNWNSQWGVSGGSFSPADNTFIGLGPFSEPETRDLSRYIETLASNQQLAGFLSFRSFGQRLVIPFAHTTDPLYNYDEMITIARRSLGSLSVKYNTQYLSGTSGSVSDGATGAVADWVKYRFNPPIAATFHLRDAGIWGYTLPAVQVLPSCEETFDALMAIIREARFINVL